MDTSLDLNKHELPRYAAYLHAAERLSDAEKIAWCEETGIGKKNPLRWWRRQIRHLRETGSVKDKVHVREATVCTPQVLALAHHLIATSDHVYKAKSLMKELQDLGVMSPGQHDAQWFTKQLKVYASGIGQPISTGWVRTFSFQADGDAELRKRFAQEMLDLLRKEPDMLWRIVFEDETTISRHPHPNGKTPRRLAHLLQVLRLHSTKCRIKVLAAEPRGACETLCRSCRS
jgi:hypothetical protein